MLLIITGCIRVNRETPCVAIRNADERLKDYLKTIRWAIEETSFTDILFGDNSDYDLDAVDEISFLKDLSRQKRKNFEYYSFQGDAQAVGRKGKGYGEGEIVSYLYEHSPVMRKYSYYYKITGRLTIQNIDKIKLSEKAENNFIFDVGMKNADTRFYKLRMTDYEEFFREAYRNVNDMENQILECVYYDTLVRNRLPFGRFNRSIEFRGKSGSVGIEYCENFHENFLTELVHESFLYRTYWGRAVLKYIRRIKVRN